WLNDHATPEQQKLLTPLSPQNAGLGVMKAIEIAEARRASPEATQKLLEEPIISGPKGWLAYGASTPDERTKALDLLGFESQLVFPTFALGQFARSQDLDVLYAGTAALNRGMAEFCARDPRLLAVGYLPLQDPARSLAELETCVKAGIRALWISAD